MEILLVSGGAETVSASIVGWAYSRNTEVRVFSLRPKSLLEGLPGVRETLTPRATSGREELLESLCSFVQRIHAETGEAVICLPSEDDSLGLLLDAHARLPHIVLMSRCRSLRRGGLDKAELFSTLTDRGLSEWIAPTKVIRSWEDVERACATFPAPLIFKPACKPWGRNLQGGGKLFGEDQIGSAYARFELEASWDAGEAWVAQPKLQPLEGHERSACVVRGNGLAYTEVVELFKYPARGGSACWVRTQPHSTLLREATEAITSALDLVGMAELSFLADADGKPRLLELNTRPWLQMELLLHSGFDIIEAAIGALTQSGCRPFQPELRETDWISLERLCAKFLRGDGARSATLADISSALCHSPLISMWSSTVPGLRARWIRWLARRLVSQIGKR